MGKTMYFLVKSIKHDKKLDVKFFILSQRGASKIISPAVVEGGFESMYPLAKRRFIYNLIMFRLAHNCLTFDFIGTSTDESSDDLCTVQIPTTWRPAFLG